MAEEIPRSPAFRPGHWRSTHSVAGRERASSSRLGKVFGILVVMVSLLGLLAALLLLWGRFQEPFFLSIPVTEYSRYLPPNAFAQGDSIALWAHFPTASKEAFSSQEKSRLETELGNLRAHKDKTVFVHLCSDALTHDGQVYLLPGDAEIDEPRTWLALDEVLQLLRDCPAANKLLVLDLKPVTDARLGLLSNDVPELLQAHLQALEKQGQLPFFVLCACSRGQVPLVSEELNHSVFGYYLDLGLAMADGYNPQGKRDSRVSVQELFAFVQARVERWALHNRNTRQTPMLFGRCADFPLTQAASAPVNNAAEEEDASPAYPKWLKDRWLVRDEWWKRKDYRIAPRVFRQMEGVLLLAEQRWRGGLVIDAIQNDLARDFDKFGRELEQARIAPLPMPHSLALAHDLKPDPAISEILRGILAQVEKLPPPANQETDAAKKALDPVLQKAQEEIEARKKALLDRCKDKFDLLAWAVVEVATEDLAPTPAKLAFLVGLLKSTQSPGEPFAETAYLQHLADIKTDDPSQWPAAAIHHALRIEQEAEKSKTFDPQVLPYVRAQLDVAAKKRRTGEELLFKAGSGSEAAANTLLEEAEHQYQDDDAAMAAVQEAQRRWDEATELLPGYASYLAAKPVSGQTDIDWTEAVHATEELGRLLAAPPAQQLPPVEELRRIREELDVHLNNLRRRMDRIRSHLDPVKGTASDLVEALALLESPCLSGAERDELWTKQRLLARRLHRETLVLDQEEEARHAQTAPPGRTSESSSSEAEDALARLRARLAIDLLKLGGFAKAAELDAALAQKGTGLQSLGDKVRVGWAQQLPRQFDELMDGGNLAAAARLSRAFHPLDHDPKATTSGLDRNPTSQLYQTRTLEFRKWVFEP